MITDTQPTDGVHRNGDQSAEERVEEMFIGKVDEPPTPPTEPTQSLEERVTALEQMVACWVWLDAERTYKGRLAAAKQVLDNPQMREALAVRLAQGAG